MKPAPAYNAVLFDWDGCLSRSLFAWLDAFRQTNDAFHIDTTDAEIVRIFGTGKVPQGTSPGRVDQDDYYESLMNTAALLLPGVGLYEGAERLIVAIRESGSRIGLVTSGIRSQIEEAVANGGLSELLDVMVTWDDVQHAKPHPEPLERALKALGVEREHGVMIGDSEKDVMAGRAAGVDTILVLHDGNELFHDNAMLLETEPTFVCRSFAEVRAVLLPG